jgi:hypothetical protein
MSVRHPIRGMDHIGITVGTRVVGNAHATARERPGDRALRDAGFGSAAGEMLTGPNLLLGLENGPGNKFQYGRTPWGITVEFLTSPGTEEYEKLTVLRRYKPAPRP